MAVEVIDGYGRVVETIDGDPYRTPGAIVPAIAEDKSIAPTWLTGGGKLSERRSEINWLAPEYFRFDKNRNVWVYNGKMYPSTEANTTKFKGDDSRVLKLRFESGQWVLCVKKKSPTVITKRLSFWNRIGILFNGWIKIDEIREVESYD